MKDGLSVTGVTKNSGNIGSTAKPSLSGQFSPNFKNITKQTQNSKFFY